MNEVLSFFFFFFKAFIFFLKFSVYFGYFYQKALGHGILLWSRKCQASCSADEETEAPRDGAVSRLRPSSTAATHG